MSFFMTCACVDYWGVVLPQFDVLKSHSIVPIHGKMKQIARKKKFQNHLRVFQVAFFFVAARELDIPGVDCVLKFDPLQDRNVFSHRVRRTACMGKEGSVVVFLLPKEEAYVDFCG